MRDGNWEVYADNFEQNDPRNFTNHPAMDYAPALSPTGIDIVFVSDRDGNKEIYVRNTLLGTVKRLTNNSVPDDMPTWSRAGGRIAFVREVAPGNTDIFVMNVDGSNEVNITNSPGNDIQPNWRPTADDIVFASDRDAKYGPSTYLEVYRMRADGSGVTRLTNNDDGVDYYPSWSPNGSEIAFTTHRPDLPQCYAFALEVFVMDADGSNQTNASNNCRGDAGATWKEDGVLILMSDRDAQAQYAWDLYQVTLGLTGTGTRLTTTGKEAGPNWKGN
jgi:Tol biopolymer transport system component